MKKNIILALALCSTLIDQRVWAMDGVQASTAAPAVLSLLEVHLQKILADNPQDFEAAYDKKQQEFATWCDGKLLGEEDEKTVRAAMRKVYMNAPLAKVGGKTRIEILRDQVDRCNQPVDVALLLGSVRNNCISGLASKARYKAIEKLVVKKGLMSEEDYKNLLKGIVAASSPVEPSASSSVATTTPVVGTDATTTPAVGPMTREELLKAKKKPRKPAKGKQGVASTLLAAPTLESGINQDCYFEAVLDGLIITPEKREEYLAMYGALTPQGRADFIDELNRCGAHSRGDFANPAGAIAILTNWFDGYSEYLKKNQAVPALPGASASTSAASVHPVPASTSAASVGNESMEEQLLAMRARRDADNKRQRELASEALARQLEEEELQAARDRVERERQDALAAQRLVEDEERTERERIAANEQREREAAERRRAERADLLAVKPILGEIAQLVRLLQAPTLDPVMQQQNEELVDAAVDDNRNATQEQLEDLFANLQQQLRNRQAEDRAAAEAAERIVDEADGILRGNRANDDDALARQFNAEPNGIGVGLNRDAQVHHEVVNNRIPEVANNNNNAGDNNNNNRQNQTWFNRTKDRFVQSRPAVWANNNRGKSFFGLAALIGAAYWLFSDEEENKATVRQQQAVQGNRVARNKQSYFARMRKAVSAWCVSLYDWLTVE